MARIKVEYKRRNGDAVKHRDSESQTELRSSEDTERKHSGDDTDLRNLGVYSWGSALDLCHAIVSSVPDRTKYLSTVKLYCPFLIFT